MFRTLFVTALSIIGVTYAATWFLMARRQQGEAAGLPTPLQSLIGFIANFLDTLGIGSFATTTSMFKLWRIVPDENVPGTLNVGHALPTMTEACIYIAMVQVDLATLLLMIGAAVAGAWIGGGIVSHWPRRMIQISMGLALLTVAALMALKQLNIIASLGSGSSLGLEGYLLVLGVCGNFALGALMTIGIGLYAPCMALVYMLGMNPLAAFPIMMGSCAFLMPVGSIQFIRGRRYTLRAALGLTLGGIPGVLLAAWLASKVKELPIAYIIWPVVVIVVYTATRMLLSARAERNAIRVAAAR
jgi:uncharacterized membrane protein YfcA